MTAEEWPSSPKALLERRYQAFEKGDIDFICMSHHPETAKNLDRDQVESWSKDSQWHGIKIEEVREEGEKAFIKFTVRYERDFQIQNHQEWAEFRKAEGRWLYYDSEFPKPESLRLSEDEKIGRNDPCHCGSGQKFKKCHGKAA